MFDKLLKTRLGIILSDILIVAVPLLGLALFVYLDVSRELERYSSEKRVAIACTAARVLDDKLRSELTSGSVYAAQPGLIDGIIKGDTVQIERRLKNIVDLSQNMERVFIASPNGILLATYPASGAIIGADYSYRDWYKGVSRSWTPYISQFFLTDLTPQTYVFAIAIPVRSAAGNVIGILVMLLKPEFIKNSLSIVSAFGGVTYLVNSKGVIIYYPIMGQDKQISTAGNSIIKKVLPGGEGDEIGSDPLTGEMVSSAYHQVDISNWKIVTERPMDEVLAPKKKLLRGILIITVILLLISLPFAWRRARMINRLNKISNELKLSNENEQTMNEELQCQKEELAENNQRLENISRIKSDFLANMSHELRTPLNTVIGFSELLQDQLFGELNQKQQRFVRNIRTSGQHLLALINDILDLSKVESGKMELELSAFSLLESLNESLMMLRVKALKGGVILHLEPGPQSDVTIAADQRKLKQIMFNLLSNAVKFTLTGGKVDVSVRRDGDFIEITVADTGIGIKAEDLAKLFQPFTQLELVYSKEFEGTGLGLALTRNLVELHGGRIWVKSEYGAGSRFCFTIPVSHPFVHETSGIQPETVQRTGNTVLLIEGDPLTSGALESDLYPE